MQHAYTPSLGIDLPRRPTCWSSSPTLTDGIRAPQRLPCMLCQSRHNLRRRSRIPDFVSFCPAGKGDAGFKGVEGQAAFVVA
jgi:hypothetical protein